MTNEPFSRFRIEAQLHDQTALQALQHRAFSGELPAQFATSEEGAVA